MFPIMKTSAWLAVVVAVAAGVAAIEESRIGRLRGQIADARRTAPAQAAARAPAGADTAPARPERVMKPLAATRGGRQPDAAAADAAPQAADSPAESVQQSLRKMVENPAGRAMMNQGIRAMAGVWYAALVKDLELSPEEHEYFLDLIGAGFSRQQELSMKMLGAKDAAERESIASELKAIENDQKEAIRDFLNNDEDNRRFLAYQERLPEYQQLDGLRAVMNEASAPLTPEQEARVVDAMFRARTATPGSSQWQQGGTQGLEAIASGDAEKQFEQFWAAAAQQAATEVGTVLQGEQLAAFKRYQEQTKEMQLMGIRMAGQMFRGQENPNPAGQ